MKKIDIKPDFVKNEEEILKFWKEILKIMLGMIIPIACGVLVMLYIDLYSVFNMILFIIAYCVIYCASMWLFAMNSYEKDLIKKPLRKIFLRGKKC